MEVIKCLEETVLDHLDKDLQPEGDWVLAEKVVPWAKVPGQAAGELKKDLPVWEDGAENRPGAVLAKAEDKGVLEIHMIGA